MAVDVAYKFSGHQTFAFRYGWLEKGVQGVANCPDLFFKEDAIVTLGVGKNMVDSIRHWCQVSQLVEPKSDTPKASPRNIQPTGIARRLLFNNGWDPFLEDDASLWLIHWLITTNPAIGTAWRLLFCRFNKPDFTRREFTNFVHDFVAKEGLKVNDSVIARDVDCLLRTYVTSAGSRNQAVAEESFACPLLQLNLIQCSPDGEIYRFAIGPKPSLPLELFAYALHVYFERSQNSAETMSIQECLYGQTSPGQVFKLDENSLIEYVEALADSKQGNVMLDETAGVKQIYRKRICDPLLFLDQYYHRGGSRK